LPARCPGSNCGTAKIDEYVVVAAGLYAKAYACLAANGFQLHWQAARAGKCANVKRASKIKIICPKWGETRHPLALRRLSD
jgi:hypothetical protein